QRKSQIGTQRKLGQLLLDAGHISPLQLARALIMQQQERSRLRVAPQAFGEFLVDKGYIKVQTLEEALVQQLRYDEQNRRVMLGEILLQLQALPRLQLARALQEYEQQFWSRFDG
ncbi:MAG: hypothetical protein MUD01_26100, partial [Chloroflexaceae bacterium]|nr:hypothetical protein [Chloroflexaceae bacterium]